MLIADSLYAEFGRKERLSLISWNLVGDYWRLFTSFPLFYYSWGCKWSVAYHQEGFWREVAFQKSFSEQQDPKSRDCWWITCWIHTDNGCKTTQSVSSRAIIVLVPGAVCNYCTCYLRGKNFCLSRYVQLITLLPQLLRFLFYVAELFSSLLFHMYFLFSLSVPFFLCVGSWRV